MLSDCDPVASMSPEFFKLSVSPFMLYYTPALFIAVICFLEKHGMMRGFGVFKSLEFAF